MPGPPTNANGLAKFLRVRNVGNAVRAMQPSYTWRGNAALTRGSAAGSQARRSAPSRTASGAYVLLHEPAHC
jgi:hypothetical protein